MKKRNLSVTLTLTFFTSLIVVTVFEVLKQNIHQDITMLESHIYTLIFSSILATAVAYFVMQRKFQLLSQVSELTAMRKQTDEILRTITDSAHDAIVIIDNKGDISLWNPAAENILGYTRSETIGRNLHQLIAPQRFQASYQTALDLFQQTGQGEAIGSTLELEACHKEGHEIHVELSLSAFLLKESWHAVGIIRDITERELREGYSDARQEVLAILNEPEDSLNSIQRILAILKSWIGCSAVAIRLQEGEDFPYLAQDGFPSDFLRTENTLISHDANGLMCRDKDGNVRLECTCGLVIEGRTDPDSPLFTQVGSFWTQDSFPLLDLPSDVDPRHNARNQCMHHGYASFALVPLRSKGRIIGLIQLNDLRKGYFTLAKVKHLEGIAAHIGTAIMRKQFEEVMRDSNERNNQFAILSGSFSWEVDAEGLYTFVDPSCEASLGYCSDQLVGSMHFYDLHPEAGREDFKQATLAIFEQQRSVKDLDKTVQTKDGRLICMSTVAFPLLYADGSLRGYRGADSDISTRKQMEDRLRESDVNYRSLAATMDSMFLVDKDSRILFANEYYIERKRLDGVTVVGSSYDDFHGEEASIIFANAVKTVIDTGKAYKDEREHLNENTYVIRTFSPVTGANGIVTAVAVSSIDITERKRLEVLLQQKMEHLRLALEASDIGIWTWDFSTERLVWDDYLCALYAVSVDDMKAGLDYQFWRCRVHPEDVEQFAELLDEARYHGTRYNDEFRIVRSDFSIRNIHSLAVVERDISGKPLRMIGINRDITPQRELEASLREAKRTLETANAELTQHRNHLEDLVRERTRDLAESRDAAESANRAKSAFLANMSHELHTPLHQIMGFGQILAEAVKDERAKGFLVKMLTSSRQLQGLVNNILEYTQISAGKIKIESVDFSLSTLLDQSEKEAREAAAAKGIQLVREVDPGLPALLKGDSAHIGQILDNLLSNAVKFSERGRITLRVSAIETHRNHMTLHFEVKDQGIGISPEVQAELFQLFNQGDNSLTRIYGGIGLGLALSNRLVTLMGGEIGVISNPGQGSTFWFTVPLPVGEMPYADTVETGLVDWSQVAATVNDLDKLLADNNGQAKILWKKSRHLVGQVLHDRLAEFEEAIQGYHFETALKLMREEVAVTPELSINYSRQ